MRPYTLRITVAIKLDIAATILAIVALVRCLM